MFIDMIGIFNDKLLGRVMEFDYGAVEIESGKVRLEKILSLCWRAILLSSFI